MSSTILTSYRIISGIMYYPAVIIKKEIPSGHCAVRRGPVRPVRIYFGIMTAGQYIIPYLIYT